MKEKMKKQIVNEIAEETGRPRAVIETVLRFQHGFVSKEINNGTFKAVRLPYWGIFLPKTKYVENNG